MRADLDALDKLDRIKAAFGDRLLANGPLSEGYARSVFVDIATLRAEILELRETVNAADRTRNGVVLSAIKAQIAAKKDRDELREWVAKQRCQDCASVWGADCLPTACNCENSRQGDGGPLCPPCRERARKEEGK